MKDLQPHLDKQKKFFLSGKTKDIPFRIEQLKKLKQILVDNEQLLINEVHKDFQKSAFETYVTEIGLVIADINFVLKNIESWTKQLSVSTPLVNFPSKNFIITEPYGSVLIISPWNYPILLALQPLVGAIAAGNTAILKPSELTPNTSSALESLISEHFDEEGNPFEVFANLGKSGGSDSAYLQAIARLASMSLRAGVEPDQIVDQLRGITDEPAWDGGTLVRSAPDAIAIALNRHISDNVDKDDVSVDAVSVATQIELISSTKKEVNTNFQNEQNSIICPDCPSVLINQEGCLSCVDCGYSKCE